MSSSILRISHPNRLPLFLLSIACYAIYTKYRWGVRKTQNFLSMRAPSSELFFSKTPFKIKLSFLLCGMVVGSTCEILVEDGRPGIKEVCHVSEFRSFQCNHNTYGLCLGLVLSGKPHLLLLFFLSTCYATHI